TGLRPTPRTRRANPRRFAASPMDPPIKPTPTMVSVSICIAARSPRAAMVAKRAACGLALARVARLAPAMSLGQQPMRRADALELVYGGSVPRRTNLGDFLLWCVLGRKLHRTLLR